MVGLVTSGVVLGILSARTIAGTLTELAGWRSVYFLSALLTLVIAAALLRFMPRRSESRSPASYPKLVSSVFRLIVEEPVLRTRAAIVMLLFMAFNVLWTPLVLPLSAPPLSLSHAAIGAFGLIGIVGALAAARAGHWADRGFAQRTTGVSLSLLLLSWLPISFAQESLGALILGIVALDLAVQAVHVTNQAMIYEVRPEARSRLTAAYMLFYSIGSAIGSIASTAIYAQGGWTAVCILGAAISAAALSFWAITLRSTPITQKADRLLAIDI